MISSSPATGPVDHRHTRTVDRDRHIPARAVTHQEPALDLDWPSLSCPTAPAP
jgi:hypothetical protein